MNGHLLLILPHSNQKKAISLPHRGAGSYRLIESTTMTPWRRKISFKQKKKKCLYYLLPPPSSSLGRKEICCAIYLAYKDEGNKKKKQSRCFHPFFPSSPLSPDSPPGSFWPKSYWVYTFCVAGSQSVSLEQFQMYTHMTQEDPNTQIFCSCLKIVSVVCTRQTK